jgi:hypothetical protein
VHHDHVNFLNTFKEPMYRILSVQDFLNGFEEFSEGPWSGTFVMNPIETGQNPETEP